MSIKQFETANDPEYITWMGRAVRRANPRHSVPNEPKGAPHPVPRTKNGRWHNTSCVWTPFNEISNPCNKKYELAPDNELAYYQRHYP